MEVYFVDGLLSRTGDAAFCTLVDGKYKIEIDEDENGDSKCYLLMHEWAHALAKPWEARVHHSESGAFSSADATGLRSKDGGQDDEG